MFSHTDTESRLAFVEGIGQYEKNYVDEDEYATAQDERLAANIGYYGEDGFFVSSQINELMRQNNDEDYLHGFEPEPQRALELEVTDDEHQENGGQEKTEEDNERKWGDLSQGERVKRALQKMIDEKAIPLKKDYALIMVALSDIKDFEGKFDNGASFCKYLTEQLKLPSDLTNASVISKRFSKMRGEFPNWSFDDVSDPNARQKLINIANRFVAIYRKGQ